MEKGSKFLAYLFPVTQEAQAQAHLQSLRKAHPKARHFCTAIRLGPEASLERSADDGEPSGSAGKPILGQLIKHQVTQIYAVVVRYFGGTKLGIPGLMEAYKTSTAHALAHAVIIQRQIYSLYRIELNYDFFLPLKNELLQQGIPLVEEVFTDRVTIKIGFRKSTADAQFLGFLAQVSQRDFDTIDTYGSFLGLESIKLSEELIL